MAEVADGKQEWEIRDIIGKEVVDGEVYYLVEWSATWVPKLEMGKAKGLVDKFEARLRAKCKQRTRKDKGGCLSQRQVNARRNKRRGHLGRNVRNPL